MTWVVDTCVLIDIAMQDPRFGILSYRALEERIDDALVIAPVTYVELAPCFDGNIEDQDQFLNGLYLNIDYLGDKRTILEAYHAWYAHIQRKHTKGEIKRPIADVLIGAYAKSLGGGLITRNEKHFKTLFPDLKILNPATA